MTHQEFIAWESASRDTIDVKRCYVDLAQGDLVAGILLSQIIFYHLPAKSGAENKLVIEREGARWLAKGRADWWAECRITPKQYDRAAGILEDIGVIETKTWKFGPNPTKHTRICWDVFLRDLALIFMRVQGGKLDIPQRSKTGAEGKPVIPQRSKSKLPKGEERTSQKGDVEVAKTVKSLTERTTQTTAKTTSKNLPPPLVPPAAMMDEEEDVNASLHEEDEAKKAQSARVDEKLAQIASITKTTTELETLRPLVIECLKREHKDAWTHTLKVMAKKMKSENDDPTIANRYAAKVLRTALESPMPPAAKPRQAPAPPPAASPPPSAAPATPAETQGDAPAPWAYKQARKEMSGPQALAFKAKHGRISEHGDWVNRARELEAEAALRAEIESYSVDDQARARAAMLDDEEQKTLLPDPEIATADIKIEALTALRDHLAHLAREKQSATSEEDHDE